MMSNPHAVLFARILDVADYLEAHGVDLGAAIKRRDRGEPGRREKEAAEERLRRAMARVFRVQARSVRETLGRLYPGRKALDTLPGNDVLNVALGTGTDDAWEKVYDVVFRSVLGGISLFEAAQSIGIDYSLVNTAAAEFARSYVFDLLKPGIDDTTRKALRSAIADFIETPGMTIGDVMKRLPFDEARALRVAVTEITRAFAEGNQLAGEQLKREFPDVRVVKQWLTNNDDLTCIICFPLHGQIVDIDKPFVHPETGAEYSNPAAHVHCRCWTTTTTDISGTAGTP